MVGGEKETKGGWEKARQKAIKKKKEEKGKEKTEESRKKQEDRGKKTAESRQNQEKMKAEVVVGPGLVSPSSGYQIDLLFVGLSRLLQEAGFFSRCVNYMFAFTRSPLCFLYDF